MLDRGGLFDLVLVFARMFHDEGSGSLKSALNGKSRGITPALCTKEEKSYSKWHGLLLVDFRNLPAASAPRVDINRYSFLEPRHYSVDTIPCPGLSCCTVALRYLYIKATPEKRREQMSSKLAEWLENGAVLVADGATGAELQAAGLQAGTIPEEWNLSHPDTIEALHLSYLDAGSKIIVSNTFGANRVKLARAGREDFVAEANLRGVEIARRAAEPYGALVAGDMGPSGGLLEPLGALTYDKAVEAYGEQARYLEEAGVDCIWIETMSDLNEARAAVHAVRQTTSLPVLCSLSFDTHGRTMMGVKPADAAEELGQLGVTAVGGNCGASLDDMLQVVRDMAEVIPGYPLIAKPNAGLPRLVDGVSVYDTSPAEMARYAVQCVAAGARIVGGCCGSTPTHIMAIAEAVNSL